MKVEHLRRTRRRLPRAAFALDEHVFYLFTQIFGRRNRDLAEKLKPFRITVPKWRVLAVLNECPDCTMNRLADLTTVDRTTLTRTVDSMAAQGLVSRGADPQDGRSVRLRLTAKGADAFRLVLPSVVEQNERAVRGLSQAELDTLRGMLHRMVRNLNPDYDAPTAWQAEQIAAGASSRRRRKGGTS